MTIKIVTDSTCDLTKELLELYHIEVLPLYIIKGGIPFQDGVDITPKDIYSYVAAGGDITSTSAVNVEDYHSCFARLASAYDAVIHINIGAGFSSCHQNAIIASMAFSNVYVVDSCNLSSGHGHVVLEAARLAEAGMTPEAIVAHLRNFIGQVDASFLLDQLDYLRRGGRCSTVVALGANLLKLKPCIEIDKGRMRVGKKYRGSYEKVLLEYVKDRLSQRRDAGLVIVVHSACAPEIVELVCQEVERYTAVPPIARPLAGCTIASHCGPCTLGIMFVRM